VLALTTLVSVPLYAWRVRGRGYAIFGLIILAIALPGALFMHRRLAELMPAAAPLLHGAFAYGMAAACTHLLGLVQARLRPRAFRWAISIPGMAFIATGALSGLWLLALLPIRGLCLLAGWTSVLQALRWLDLAPFALGIASVMTSLRTVEEIVRIPLDRAAHPSFTRLPVERRRPGARDRPRARRRRWRARSASCRSPIRISARGSRCIGSSAGSSGLVAHDPIWSCSPATSSRWRAPARPARSPRRWRRSSRSPIAATPSSATTTTKRRTRYVTASRRTASAC
jgi:hypothetical protein